MWLQGTLDQGFCIVAIISQLLLSYTDAWWSEGGEGGGENQQIMIGDTLVHFRLNDQVSSSSVETKCKELHPELTEYTPATNADVQEVIDALDDFDEDTTVWIKSTYDPSKSPVNAFSWSSEPFDVDMWFTRNRYSGGTERMEPNSDSECTVLRKTYGIYSSRTGKHMLGNKGCSDSNPFLCAGSPTTTTEADPTTELATTAPPPTTEPPTTEPPTTEPPTTEPPTTEPLTTEPPTTEPPTTEPPTTKPPTTEPPTTEPPTTEAITTTQPPETTTQEQPTTDSEVTTQNTATTEQTLPTEESSTSQTQTQTEIQTTQTNTQPENKETKEKVERLSVPVLVCPCECPQVVNKNLPSSSNISQEEFVQEKTTEIQKNLTVPSADLSSTVRKKTSAEDKRPTSQIGGVIAITVVLIVFGVIAVSDMFVYSRYLCNGRYRTR